MPASRDGTPPDASSPPMQFGPSCWPRRPLRPDVGGVEQSCQPGLGPSRAWTIPQPSRANDQEAAKVSIALLADPAEPRLAACGILPRHKPSQAANSRPLLNMPGSATVAAIAEAITGPMPGMVAKRRLTGLLLCQASSCASTMAICASSTRAGRP